LPTIKEKAKLNDSRLKQIFTNW